jgi:hypothetical protein
LLYWLVAFNELSIAESFTTIAVLALLLFRKSAPGAAKMKHTMATNNSGKINLALG